MPYAIGIVSSMMVATSQLLLKLGANRCGDYSLIKQYLNRFVLAGYLLFLLVTIFNVYVFSIVPLKMANIFVALSHVGVLVLSRVFLGERVELQRIFGVVLIALGVGLYIV